MATAIRGSNMQCSRCGAENGVGAAACTQCGTSLVPAPPGSGTPPPPPPPPPPTPPAPGETGWGAPPPPPPPGGQQWQQPGQQWSPPGQQPYGGYGQGYGAPAQVPNYLVQSILLTIFCCLPFGIVAIVYSSQATSKAGMGDYPGAFAAAKKAKTWCWASLGGWLVMVLLGVLVVVSLGSTSGTKVQINNGGSTESPLQSDY